jgi:hypothetical protein
MHIDLSKIIKARLTATFARGGTPDPFSEWYLLQHFSAENNATLIDATSLAFRRAKPNVDFDEWVLSTPYRDNAEIVTHMLGAWETSIYLQDK